MRAANGKRYRVRSQRNLVGRGGRRITAKGDLTGRTLKADSVRVGGSAAQPLARAAATGGPQKVAVLLFNFQNNNSQPWTTDQVRGYVFTNSSSVNEYYKEESSSSLSLTGKVRSDGDVFGWYTIPKTDGNCDPFGWGALARQAAEAAGPRHERLRQVPVHLAQGLRLRLRRDRGAAGHQRARRRVAHQRLREQPANRRA